MSDGINPLAPHDLPWFIAAPGETDGLLVGMGIFLVAVLLAAGNLYFQLHALPERWAHKRSPIQVQIVAILALLALFTHNHIFWIAALLLALVQFPDFATPIYSMADSLRALSGRRREPGPEAIQASSSADPSPYAAMRERLLEDEPGGSLAEAADPPAEARPNPPTRDKEGGNA